MNEPREHSEELKLAIEVSLVERALAPNRGALKQLVDYLAPTIRKKAYAVLQAHLKKSVSTELEDVYQQVFFRLFRTALRQWDRKRPLQPFVATVTKNTAIDWLRQREIFDLTETIEEEPGEDPRISFEDRDEARKLVGELVEHLTPQEAYLLQRLVVDELSFEDLSNETGISVKNLHVRKHRLLKKAASIAEKIRGGQ